MTDLHALFQDMSLQTILRHLSQLPGVISVEMTLEDGKKLVSEEIKPSDELKPSESEAV